VAVSFVDDAPLVADRVLAVVEALGERLVRAKGFVNVAGESRRGFVERAGVRTELRWAGEWAAGEPRRSEIVLIGDGLDEAAVRRALWACRSGG
jgi:G3E family GTPase